VGGQRTRSGKGESEAQLRLKCRQAISGNVLRRRDVLVKFWTVNEDRHVSEFKYRHSLVMMVTLNSAPPSLLSYYRPILNLVRSSEYLNPLKRLTRDSKRRGRGHLLLASTRYHSMMSELCSKPDQELFTYTSGRYLYNEKLRLAERHVHFDVPALKDIAADCVRRRSVTRMEKLAEGGFSRVFLLTMDDGFEVIAKLPYSLTVPKHFTTESEVATLDFLSSKGVPVPRVYAWSSEGGNAVGSEYVIMEKAPGQPLESRWFSLTQKERVRLVTSFVEIERKMFSFALGSYGSLYYKGRLPSHLQADLYGPEMFDDSGDASRFCIGPATDYMFWRGKRAQLDLNRGPC